MHRASAWRSSKRLLDDGWPVAVLDADEAALAAAENAFADENAIFLAADVTDEDEIAARLRRRWSTGSA